eukprot:gene30204-36489_t
MSKVDYYAHIKALYGLEGFEKLQKAKVLIVGAGGIGCEILKNLAFSGVTDVEIIDLDTIDVSNLNRQFLFRPEHVGQSKALVAASVSLRFNPELSIKAYHDNIKNSKYSVDYFSKFSVVLNALDNVDARRHVNRMCLAANVPLIDSGTTGYLGQVTPIIKGWTACYECHPKPAQKVYPICTIRSTPDKPVHCIVWAKECFKLFFNNPKDSMLFEDENTETSAYMSHLPFRTGGFDNLPDKLAYFTSLLYGVFNLDVQKRIDMDVYKTAKALPVPLDRALLDQAVATVLQRLRGSDSQGQSTGTLPPSPLRSQSDWEHSVWGIQENILELMYSLLELPSKGGPGQETAWDLVFDKDDDWAMRVVLTLSNIRSHIFGIPLQSYHDAKGIAGNIIPAIATTNAIIAAAQVTQMVNMILHFSKAALYNPDPNQDRSVMLKALRTYCPYTYCLRSMTRRGHLLEPSEAEEPVTGCYVCQTAQLTLEIDTSTSLLGDVVTHVLKGKLGFIHPNVSIGHNGIYEEGDGADEDLADNLNLVLQECPGGGVGDGVVLTVEDFEQKLEVKLLVKHVSTSELPSTDVPHPFRLGGGNLPVVQAEASKPEEDTKGAALSGDDGIMILDDDVEVVGVAEASAGDANKRKVDEADGSNTAEPEGKRRKI